MTKTRWMGWAAVAVLATGLAFAGDDEAPRSGPLAVGAKAPDFRLNDDSGHALRLSEHGKGAWTILAFFPKASTPG